MANCIADLLHVLDQVGVVHWFAVIGADGKVWTITWYVALTRFFQSAFGVDIEKFIHMHRYRDQHVNTWRQKFTFHFTLSS